jgi:O-antigen ligase
MLNEQHDDNEPSAIPSATLDFNPSKTLPDLRDFNFGIILVAAHIFLEMGAFQHIFDYIVTPLKIPFLVSTITIGYGLYLMASGKTVPASATSRALLLLVVFYVIYSLIASLDPIAKNTIWKIFLPFFFRLIILLKCITRKSQFVLIVDIFLLAVAHTCFRTCRSSGKLWGDTYLGDENEVSVLAVCAVPFAFYLFLCSRSIIKRVFYAGSISLSVWLVMVASSRGGMLALCVTGLLIWLFIRKKITALFVIIAAVILVLNFAPKKIFNRLSVLKAQGTEEQTAFDRIYGWHTAFMMFYDYPIFGVGPGNFQERFPEYSYKYSKVAKRVPNRSFRVKRVAHSTPFEWLATTGIAGSFLMLMLIGALFKNWLIVNKSRKIIGPENAKKTEFILIESIGLAAAIAIVSFWVGGLFITIIAHPFLWILIPISDIAKNFTEELEYQYTAEELGLQENFNSPDPLPS